MLTCTNTIEVSHGVRSRKSRPPPENRKVGGSTPPLATHTSFFFPAPVHDGIHRVLASGTVASEPTPAQSRQQARSRARTCQSGALRVWGTAERRPRTTPVSALTRTEGRVMETSRPRAIRGKSLRQFGERVRELRVRAGLGWANKAGTSRRRRPSSLNSNRVEAGRENLGFSCIHALAAALDVAHADLFYVMRPWGSSHADTGLTPV